MIDIVSVGGDIGLADTDVGKASNILSTQLGDLEYLPDFGIDLEFFLDERFQFQNDSFNAYLIETLSNQGINVTEVTSEIRSLYQRLTLKVTGMQNDSSLVR
jgi:hypothetical protein